jgi:hypothetical protein
VDPSHSSRLVEQMIVESPVLPEVQVRLEVIAGGVTFDDGTTVKILTAADFNELGEAIVRFVQSSANAGAVCHRLLAYQEGVFLGKR